MAFNHNYPYRAGYGSFYPFAFRSLAYAQQKYQDESDLLGFGTSPFQTPEAAGILSPNMNSIQDIDSVNYGLRSESPTVESPLVTPVPLFSSQRNNSKILSPSAQSVAHIQLEKLLEMESLNEPDSPVPVVEKSPFCSDMPIGSLVHSQGPQEWGVVKIANIPYSVTKQEIIQFLGRQARLIRNDQGCAIHIIMERSTAKTMDCYAEFQTVQDAQNTVTRINNIFDTGRAPRLGNRVVDVELSSQDELLKDLFPRAKCLVWKGGIPIALQNFDFYSTGFAGFFTKEEIYGAIRHAEMPHRSPFGAKCLQRTYESTISTLHKFPWHATKMYTVDDRNSLFGLTNRHIKSLVYRLKTTKTIGVDCRLLRDLLHAGMNCPAFNERQKFTLCINSEEIPEIRKLPDMSKWFPFDTLVKMPQFESGTLMYYAKLISKGHLDDHSHPGLPNSVPTTTNLDIESPYGPIWFEWPDEVAQSLTWEDAVYSEMMNLCNLIMSGCIRNEREANTFRLGHLLLGSTATTATSSSLPNNSNTTVSPPTTDKTQVSEDSPSKAPSRTIYATPHYRRAKHIHGASCAGVFTKQSDYDDIFGTFDWTQRLPTRSYKDTRARFGHRNTLSSPCFLPKSGGGYC